MLNQGNVFLKQFFVVILLCSLGLCSPLLAQQTGVPGGDTETAAKPEVTQTDEEKAEAERLAKEKAEQEAKLEREKRAREAARRDGGFKPSEEISEDLPAPFPVDI